MVNRRPYQGLWLLAALNAIVVQCGGVLAQSPSAVSPAAQGVVVGRPEPLPAVDLTAGWPSKPPQVGAGSVKQSAASVTASPFEIVYGDAPLLSQGTPLFPQATLPLRTVSDGAALADLAIPLGLQGSDDSQPSRSQSPPAAAGSPAAAPSRGDLPNFADLALPTVDARPQSSNSVQALPPPPSRQGASESPSRLGTQGLGGNRATPFDPLDALPPAMLGDVAKGGTIQGDAPAATSTAQEQVAAPGPIPSNAPPRAAHEPASSPASTAPDTASKQPSGPVYFESYGSIKGPSTDVLTQQVPYDAGAFLPQPVSQQPTNSFDEGSIYRGKLPVPVQRPWLELGRPLYTGGIYPPAKEWLGRYNLIMPHFMVYGDFRTGVGVNRNAAGDANSWAQRLNLDMDLEITATERIHAFMGPLDRAGDYTRLDFTNSAEFVDRTDIRLDNLFFEGDLGAIVGGLNDSDAPFDLPFSFGFLPFFYQNGIWAADNVIGAAVAIPARHSRRLNWSNYDATFFWASDQVNTDAFAGDNNAAELFGTAWFIDAYDGYIEADYAFVHDDVGLHRSYHNFSVAFTRRYFHRISNSVRFITNFNQSLPREERTAQGHMILIENSLISTHPNTFVPYANFFYGQGRTQSLARAANAGGILNNTGINFETDGLTAYPTLDATGVNTTGGAVGFNMLGANFDQQLIVEFAALAANGSTGFRNAPGDQYALGMRYQKPLNNYLIFRTDHMIGLRRNADDLRGSRVELRWKF